MRRSFSDSRLNAVADPYSLNRTTGVQIDWANVPDRYRSTAIKVQAAAAAILGAVSITVDPLLSEVPAGTLLDFGGGKLARVSADSPLGDTSLAVDALSDAIADNDVAYIGGAGGKRIPAFTALVKVTNGHVPRAVRPGSETVVGYIETDADESLASDAKSGYGLLVGGVLYENLMPDADTGTGLLPSAYKTEAAAAGTGFSYQRYQDTR